jgi:hypothetical protein
MGANVHEPEVRAKMTAPKAIDGDIFDSYVAYLAAFGNLRREGLSTG